MSKIDYQALREAAERAIPAMERLLMLPADDDLLSEQELKDYGVDIDALNAFKFLAGPETVLALLDERERNQQYIKRRDQENEDIALTVGKLRVELETEKSKLNEQREYYEGVIADGSKRIAELEAREVSLPERSSMLHRTDFHEDYQTVMAYKVSEVIDAIRAAGIRIKGGE
ncbi:TPA: ead/Ea22-like family protein [Escherichia coli]|nr:ead/Ea22-like family protein [Escherichia coli]